MEAIFNTRSRTPGSKIVEEQSCCPLFSAQYLPKKPVEAKYQFRRIWRMQSEGMTFNELERKIKSFEYLIVYHFMYQTQNKASRRGSSLAATPSGSLVHGAGGRA